MSAKESMKNQVCGETKGKGKNFRSLTSSSGITKQEGEYMTCVCMYVYVCEQRI